jgi:transposase
MADQPVSVTPGDVVVGVDTHLEFHVAVAVDHLGRVLDTTSIDTTPAGYRQLLSWVRRHGRVVAVGVEGTGAYGAGLTRFLIAQDVVVIEVNRPNRQQRRRRGKSDPTDAESAARAVLAGEATVVPKTGIGIVESIRVLRIARSSAMKARTQVGNQIKDLVLTAPEPLRGELRPLKTKQRTARCARKHATPGADPLAATKRALRHLARRWEALSAEIAELDADLAELTRAAAPRLLAQPGIGIETAGKLLVTAGDNPERLHHEAALAALCGVSPVEASSGKITRHRLNRGGNRQGNNALWTIAFNRCRYHPDTRAYLERRRKEGKSDREILRCLKRYIARQLHPLLIADLDHARRISGPLT